MQWIQTDKVLFFRFWEQDFLKLIYFYVKIQQLHLLLPHPYPLESTLPRNIQHKFQLFCKNSSFWEDFF